MSTRRLLRELADYVFELSAKLPGVHALVLAVLQHYASSRNLSPRDVRILCSCAQRLTRQQSEWIVKTPGGLLFDVADQAQSVNAMLLFRGERFDHAWEPQSSRLLLALTRPDDRVVFAGANVGYDAVLIGDRLRGTSGRCYAFEPVGVTFDALRKNIALNDLTSIIVPFQIALGRADGTGQISVAGESSSLIFHRGKAAVPTEEVVIRSLDSMCRNGTMPAVTALIMDVEGFEIEVASGAEALLQSGSLRFVLTEINRATDVVAPDSNDAVLNRLSAAGFDLYAVIDDYQGRRIPTNGPCELKRIDSANAAFATGGRWLNVLAIRGNELAPLSSQIRVLP